MPHLTKQELESIRVLLMDEENLICHFTSCAHSAQDPQLRAFLEQIAARHRVHWELLAALLNTGEG